MAPLVKVVLQQTVAAPSVLGAEPAFEGDVLNVSEETAAELIAAGVAQTEEALAAAAKAKKDSKSSA